MRNICRMLIILTTLAATACGAQKATETQPIEGDTLALRHASLLTIVDCGAYSVVDIKSPWNDRLLHRYILTEKGCAPPSDIPEGTLLRLPLENLLIFSTVHSELICNLGRSHSIGGVCEAQYMTQPLLQQRLGEGSLIDCGSTLNINSERVVQLAPEAVWVLPYENGGYGKMDKLPYPLIECADYMENSPLACAEWMRFYGRLLGEGAKADSLFAAVERDYLALRDSIKNHSTDAPTLMCELKNGSAWYVPGGGSTMGQLYRDAGCDYLFAQHDRTGSVPLAFEAVLTSAAEADFWLVKYGGKRKTHKSLLAEFEGYKYFRPYKERNIYECRLSEKRFYEETPFRPDILLRELAAIFHPEIIKNHKPRYYEKMQEQ
ncbi:MAG: ABC transporter substrate-binding protein [Bacteroidaceae bacterium]|nr:ABC transporter substrate-binding protein [Bacteroidaceae bacterium]